MKENVGVGPSPFALASIAGGETYWHACDSGDDAAQMSAALWHDFAAATTFGRQARLDGISARIDCGDGTTSAWCNSTWPFDRGAMGLVTFYERGG